jgi:hypothetical protein
LALRSILPEARHALFVAEQVQRSVGAGAPKILTSKILARCRPIPWRYPNDLSPVSAAVAVETLKIYEERGILAEVRKVGPYLQEKLQALADHLLVGEHWARG